MSHSCEVENTQNILLSQSWVSDLAFSPLKQDEDHLNFSEVRSLQWGLPLGPVMQSFSITIHLAPGRWEVEHCGFCQARWVPVWVQPTGGRSRTEEGRTRSLARSFIPLPVGSAWAAWISLRAPSPHPCYPHRAVSLQDPPIRIQ